MKITKLRSEDAQAIGLAKFQQIYPNGTISKEILYHLNKSGRPLQAPATLA